MWPLLPTHDVCDPLGWPAEPRRWISGEQISAVWYARVQADDDLRAAFLRDTATNT
jgi:hypothetical protein